MSRDVAEIAAEFKALSVGEQLRVAVYAMEAALEQRSTHKLRLAETMVESAVSRLSMMRRAAERGEWPK